MIVLGVQVTGIRNLLKRLEWRGGGTLPQAEAAASQQSQGRVQENRHPGSPEVMGGWIMWAAQESGGGRPHQGHPGLWDNQGHRGTAWLFVKRLCLSLSPHFALSSVCACLVAQRVLLFAIPWTVARQAPLCWGFSRLEYWSGLLRPPLGFLPNPGTAGGFFTIWATREALSLTLREAGKRILHLQGLNFELGDLDKN